MSMGRSLDISFCFTLIDFLVLLNGSCGWGGHMECAPHPLLASLGAWLL